jgi:hypothetical protein
LENFLFFEHLLNFGNNSLIVCNAQARLSELVLQAQLKEIYRDVSPQFFLEA